MSGFEELKGCHVKVDFKTNNPPVYGVFEGYSDFEVFIRFKNHDLITFNRDSIFSIKPWREK